MFEGRSIQGERVKRIVDDADSQVNAESRTKREFVEMHKMREVIEATNYIRRFGVKEAVRS
jgi:hypothetical protein